jgi:RNA polymerase sigma factor (sigma-70 family)
MATQLLKNHSDDELVNLYKANSSGDILRVLFDRYYHLVFGICMKYLRNTEDAKDATMLIFEKLMTDIPKHEIQFFKAWLYRVAQNHCLMQLRKKKPSTVSTDIFPVDAVEYDENLHPALAKEQLLTKMEDAITQLNQEQQACITLFYLEKKTYTEIMQQTGFNFMQVKSYIQNGKRNLKNSLTNNTDE